MSVSVGRETPWVWIRFGFDLGARAAFLAQHNLAFILLAQIVSYKWHVATTVAKSLYT